MITPLIIITGRTCIYLHVLILFLNNIIFLFFKMIKIQDIIIYIYILQVLYKHIK